MMTPKNHGRKIYHRTFLQWFFLRMTFHTSSKLGEETREHSSSRKISWRIGISHCSSSVPCRRFSLWGSEQCRARRRRTGKRPRPLETRRPGSLPRETEKNRMLLLLPFFPQSPVPFALVSLLQACRHSVHLVAFMGPSRACRPPLAA